MELCGFSAAQRIGGRKAEAHLMGKKQSGVENA